MSNRFSDTELAAYLDEALPSERMTQVESALRDDSSLVERIKAVVGKQDAGVHSLGSIWRRNRLSCPTREQLGSYLLKVLDLEHTEYIRFHLETIGCRCCNASLDDLNRQHLDAETTAIESRRSRYFQSSAGYLSQDD